MLMKQITAMFMFVAFAPANAIDKFDIMVCEAMTGSEAKLGCYKELKVMAECNKDSIERQLSCYQKGIASLVQISSSSQKATAELTPDGARPPLNLTIKGGNFDSRVHVDNGCIYRGEMESQGGPAFAHLSETKLVYYAYPTMAALVCKDGSDCILATHSGDWNLNTHTRSKPYLVKRSKVTVAIDFANHSESDIALEKLGEVILWCQSVQPDYRWVNRYKSANTSSD